MQIIKRLLVILTVFCSSIFAVRIDFEGDISHWFQYDQASYFGSGLSILLKPKVEVSNGIFEFALDQFRPYDTKIGHAYGVGLDKHETRFVLNEQTNILGKTIYYDFEIGNVSVNYLPELVQFGKGADVPEQLGIKLSSLLPNNTFIDFFWTRPENVNEFYWGGQFNSSIRGISVRGSYADYIKTYLEDGERIQDFQDTIWSVGINKRIGSLLHFACTSYGKNTKDEGITNIIQAADGFISYMGNMGTILTMNYWHYPPGYDSLFRSTYVSTEKADFLHDSFRWRWGKKGVGFKYSGLTGDLGYDIAYRKYENLHNKHELEALVGEFHKVIGHASVKLDWELEKEIEFLPNNIKNSTYQHTERITINVPFRYRNLRVLIEYSRALQKAEDYLAFAISPANSTQAKLTAKFMDQKGKFDLFFATTKMTGFNLSYILEPRVNQNFAFKSLFYF